MRCDVTEWDDQQALVARALEAFGRLDVAFANAGFGGAARLHEGDAGGVEGDGAHERLRRGADDPRDDATRCARRKGHLLLTGSVAGRRALPGSLYSATKRAVTRWARRARQEFDDTGVRVTLIEPGMVDTPFFDKPPQIERAGGRRHRPRRDVRRRAARRTSDVNEMLVRPTAQPRETALSVGACERSRERALGTSSRRVGARRARPG